MSKLWVGVKGLGIVITGAIAFSGNSAIANSAISIMGKFWFGVKGLGIVITGAIAFSGNSAIANINQETNLPNSLGIAIQENTRTLEGGNQSGSNQFRSCKQDSVSTLGKANLSNAANLHHNNSGIKNPAYSRLGNDTLKLQYSLDQTDNQVNTAVNKQSFQKIASTIADINTVQGNCLVCGIENGEYVCYVVPC